MRRICISLAATAVFFTGFAPTGALAGESDVSNSSYVEGTVKDDVSNSSYVEGAADDDVSNSS